MKTYPALAALTLIAALFAVLPARASTELKTTALGPSTLSGSSQGSLTGGAVSLLDSVGLMGKGQGQLFSDAVTIPTAGTLTVTLAGISWLDALQNLNCFVSAPGGGLIGNGKNGLFDSVQVQQGTVYVNWYGQDSGPVGLGAYAISVQFQPAAPPPPPVPLPAALPLMLSGLAALAGLCRSRATGAIAA
ncbi:MAG TPA: hypothetical protein VMT09_04885 [Steroidobacteraceae bacterium]|nr:hypothetical protein [Steroidobacteraceae bacterium]